MGKQWKTAGKLAQSSKKGALFTRLSREIQVAVQLGGDNPANNHRLRLAIQTAKTHCLPKSTIKKAIIGGKGEEKQGQMEELIYEGFGPHGVAMVLRCLTDNRTRTASQIRNLFKINKAQMGASGSVMWMFDRLCFVRAKKENTELEENIRSEDRAKFLEKMAVEVKAIRVKRNGNTYLFYREKEKLQELEETLKQKTWSITETGLAYYPKNELQLDEEKQTEVRNFLKLFKEHPDCKNIYCNFIERK